MAIPGLKPSFEVRAKVRIGEKKKTASGKEYPSSVDYFLSDDPAFPADKPKQLRIFFPYAAPDDAFSTGLEWWQGALLACYSKGEIEGGVPVALRRETMKKGDRVINLLEGANVLSQDVIGNDRRKIECPVRDCPLMKKKDGCKPMGRLVFWIDGIDRRPGVFQLDTKSWNTIENLEGVLGQYPDLRNIPFLLSVAFEQRGRDRFPVLSLEEDVEINSEDDAALADALVQLRGRYDDFGAYPEKGDTQLKLALCGVLDLKMPGWRERQDVIDRMKAIGAVQAARTMLENHGV